VTAIDEEERRERRKRRRGDFNTENTESTEKKRGKEKREDFLGKRSGQVGKRGNVGAGIHTAIAAGKREVWAVRRGDWIWLKLIAGRAGLGWGSAGVW